MMAFAFDIVLVRDELKASRNSGSHIDLEGYKKTLEGYKKTGEKTQGPASSDVQFTPNFSVGVHIWNFHTRRPT